MNILNFLGIACAAASPSSPAIRHRQSSNLEFASKGNPILADGSYYSADPAPLVVNGTVYIVAGRDEAGPAENGFVINEWEILSTTDPSPEGGEWTLHPAVARPEDVFAWASAGTAYAAQLVQGADGRFYLYAPVTQRDAGGATDAFAIGVGVADSPLGPFEDAHPEGPIISQTVPAPGNGIQNIDPTVLVDDDGRVYIYFGTFGQLLAYELSADDMTTILGEGAATRIGSLTGFFEAPWLMKRQGTYYLLYAANNAGADSPCTPTSYHACIAYGTASSPLGPWTYRGIVLDIVSSTTSHPGVFELNGQSLLVYHTRDAEGGTHFRRSVAFDALGWDDSTTPPSIQKVTQTHRPSEDDSNTPIRNIALRAVAESANETPIQYWIAAINDGRIETNPLPPDYWSSYAAEQSPETSTLTLTWNETVQLNGTSMAFFADQRAGSNIGVGFETISTTALRAVLTASGQNGQFGGVGVKEFFAFSPTAS
ncbi:glycosyl hydrolase family 43 protein [Camillea tinctor]|nr:glycosyl hydrolase family 43 protein [Camillea tinctor]